ncbi:hypothetical protein GO485_00245 [Pseudoduganella flava]|uniref:Carrier domain-containing protein n=2 Tax=Pseudoduganella flava TaxID=871742 RepID=A0ABX6FK55_9BURK|nr:hypothetical protein GO485_00245 [Pseudoduganella flava]
MPVSTTSTKRRPHRWLAAEPHTSTQENDMLQVDIQHAVEKAIRDVADEWDLALPPLRPDSELVDELGFSSMTVVSLTMNLEEELGVDPFADRSVMLTAMRTIQDLCDVYGRALAAAAPASAASI